MEEVRDLLIIQLTAEEEHALLNIALLSHTELRETCVALHVKEEERLPSL